ncbi:MAG: PorT family protein [Flavobacteriales bacterium]|nr:PorT family protein [Flavobacteriales bacterium]
MRISYLIIGLLSVLFCSGQNEFESGYIVDNNGKKINCFIKNMDWYKTPSSIEIKETENSNSKTSDISEIKEFSIDNGARYIRAITNVEISKADLQELDFDRKPKLEKQTIFLKIEVDDKGKLYSYTTQTKLLYYFSNGDSDIELLIFKEYYNEDRQLAKNLMYQQQLLNSLKCEKISKGDIEHLRYKKHYLVKLFEKYNQCADPEFEKVSKNKGKFNISIRAGINYASVSIKEINSNEIKSDWNTNYRIGLELEYLLSTNNNKWGIILDPNYQEYNSSQGQMTNPSAISFSSESKILQFPLGLRYYSHISDKSRVFFTGALSINFLLKDAGVNVSYPFTTNSFRYDRGWATSNFLIGFGYSFNKKLCLELQYESPLAMTSSSGGGANGAEAYYNSIGLILGYTLF